MKLYKFIPAGLAFSTGLAMTPAAAQTVTVGAFGGNWGAAFDTCVMQPFTKATGIKVVTEIGTSTVNLAKIEQQKADPVIDAVWMDGGISELGMNAGVLDNLDPAKIPNLAKVADEGIYKADGITFAVSTGFYAVGIAYNKDEVKNPPTSWNDLWNAEFKDAITFPAPANALGIPTVFFLNQALGLEGGVDATFKKLKELQAAQFYDSSGVAANAFQSGEAVIGVYNNAPTWDLNARGLPLEFVVPKEGAWGGDVRLHLVKGAKNKEAAERFIDTALTPEASACLADKLYLGPSVEGAVIAADTKRKMPWGANGSIKDLKFLDWNEVHRQRPDLVDRWNREIARR